DQQDQAAYYKRNGSAASLVYDLVRSHIGQNARPEFKRTLVVDSPGGWANNSVSINSRFKTVLEEVQTLANNANVVVSLFQDDIAKTTRMSIEQTRELARVIRMTENKGQLGNWGSSDSGRNVSA